MRVDYYHAGSIVEFSAGALRTMMVANALALSGHEVTVISADGSDVDLSMAGVKFGLNPSVRLLGGGRVGGPQLLPRRLDPTAKQPPSGAEIMILFGATPVSFGPFRARADALGIPFILDLDEWMGPKDFSAKSWATMFPLRYERFMRTLPNQIHHAFAISRRMAAHIEAGGAQTMRLPPVHEPNMRPPDDGREGRLRLVLPGVRVAGKGKDRLPIQLLRQALELQPSLAKRIQVDIVGGVEVDKGGHASRLADLVDYRDHGRVSWARARELVAGADWMVAVRDPDSRRLRYSFPSKVTESLVLGTPVLANDYSDVSELFQEGPFGVMVQGVDASSFASALEQALTSPFSKRNVANSAGKRFTPAAVANDLDDFVTAIADEVRAS